MRTTMFSDKIGMEHSHQEIPTHTFPMTNSTQQDQQLMTPLHPQTVILKDGETVATMYPIPSFPQLLPPELLNFLLDEFNMEIEKGDSFPYYETLSMEEFQDIWFNRDGHICIMVLGEIPELDYSADNIYPRSESADKNVKNGNSNNNGIDNERNSEEYLQRKRLRNFNFKIPWEKQCLGLFQLQPAYPGRSSHVVTGTFLVNAGIRGKGIGKTLSEIFIEWSKKLGFTSCCFPLIYGTNVGIRRILEDLNFRRVGRLPEAGILKGYDVPVDSFIYAKEFTHIKRSIDLLRDPEKSNEIAKYERLRYYLETGEYPLHCDRSEKARLRVSAKNHNLLNGKLMTKGREVVYDPVKQRQIALETHNVMHEGINKITSKIAKKYHWKRIKHTVSEVIAQCQKCKMRYPDENGVIITAGEVPVTQAHMLPSNVINANDLVKKGNNANNINIQDSKQAATTNTFNTQATTNSKRSKSKSENEQDHLNKKLKYNEHQYSDSYDNLNNTNTFNKFIADEMNKNRTSYIDAATKVLVDMNDKSDQVSTKTKSNKSNSDNIMNDAMLNLEDNVMAALEIVQKEQAEQQQQQQTEDEAAMLRRQHENEQFLLSFDFDAAYQEEEDEDYQDDDDEEEEDDDDDDEEEEEYPDDRDPSNGSRRTSTGDIHYLQQINTPNDSERYDQLEDNRRKVLQDIQEIEIENAIDDDNDDLSQREAQNIPTEVDHVIDNNDTTPNSMSQYHNI